MSLIRRVSLRQTELGCRGAAAGRAGERDRTARKDEPPSLMDIRPVLAENPGKPTENPGSFWGTGSRRPGCVPPGAQQTAWSL